MAKRTKIEAYDITIEDVTASNLIPNLDTMFLKFIGKNWYRDGVTGVAYHFAKDSAGALSIKETRQSIATKVLKPKQKPKPPAPKFVTIKCVDCGAEREIHTADAFQVKRCVACQQKYRSTKRLARLKERRDIGKSQEVTKETRPAGV